MSNVSISNSSTFFSCTDFLSSILVFSSPEDIGRLARVGSCFNNFINNFNVWRVCFETAGIPRVMDADGTYRDDSKHFNIMRLSTHINANMIAGVFGKVIGSIPPVSGELVDSLNKSDPFEILSECQLMFLAHPLP